MLPKLFAPDGAPSGAVAAPPPAKPAPAPAQAPAAAPPPKPSPAAAAKPDPMDDNPFAAADAKARAKREAQAIDKPPGASEKPGDAGTPPGDTAPPGSRNVENIKMIRTAYEKSKAELTGANQKIAAMEKRIAEAEEQGKSIKALNDRLATLQKERDEMEGSIRSLKQEASPEFKAKYEQPFNDAAEFAKTNIEALEIITDRGDDANGIPATTRAAKWEDFAALYNLPLNKAIAAAKQQFGDGAQTVINHLTELQRLGFQRDRALREEKAKFKENQDKEIANRSQEQERIANLWREYNRQIADREPTYFAPDPNDKEASDILAEGFKVVDSVHNKTALTVQQRVRLDAEIRNRAAAHPLMVYRLQQAQAKIADLESRLTEMKGSEPGSTKNPGGAQGIPADDDDWKAAARREMGD